MTAPSPPILLRSPTNQIRPIKSTLRVPRKHAQQAETPQPYTHTYKPERSLATAPPPAKRPSGPPAAPPSRLPGAPTPTPDAHRHRLPVLDRRCPDSLAPFRWFLRAQARYRRRLRGSTEPTRGRCSPEGTRSLWAGQREERGRERWGGGVLISHGVVSSSSAKRAAWGRPTGVLGVMWFGLWQDRAERAMPASVDA